MSIYVDPDPDARHIPAADRGARRRGRAGGWARPSRWRPRSRRGSCRCSSSPGSSPAATAASSSSSSSPGTIDYGVRDPVQARRRRALADPRRPDDDAGRGSRSCSSFRPDQGPLIKLYMMVVPLSSRSACIGVFVALRRGPLLRLLGDRPRPDVPDHGICGGSDRIYATVKFVLYTLVGSLLMLVAILAGFAYQSATGSWDDRSTTRCCATSRRRERASPAGSSWARSSRSSSRSRSRCRCSRSTPGCRTPTQAPTAGSVMLAGDHAEARRLRLHPVRPAAVPDAAQRSYRVVIALA